MADKEIKVKITTETDISSVEDLRNVLDELRESVVSIDVVSDVDEVNETLDEIDGSEVEPTVTVDKSSADDLKDTLEETGEMSVEPDVTVDSSEAEELGDTLDDIDGKSIEPEINVDKSGVDELSDSLDDADEKAQQLGDDLGLINADVTLDIADKIGGMGSSAENAAQQMNEAAISVGQLAKNAGMAEPQMVGLINNISNATFPQNEALAYVNTLNQMGVSADKLGASATNMDRINDATGIGYQKTMELTQGLRSMGVSADNLPSSFNAIAYAQANVNGGADTLSRVLKRQAGTLNEYGLSVDQTVLIMQKLSETGVSSTKMGTALSEVLKENNGDISAIEQSLGLQEGALANAADATGQYSGQLQNLADEEAEHKTWLDQLKAGYEDLTLAMSPVLEPAASFLGIIGQAGSYAVGINGIIQLGNSIKGLSFISTARDWLSGLGSSVSTVGSKFLEAGTRALTFARNLMGSVLSAVRNAITSLASLARTVLMTGLNALKAAAMWAWEKLTLIASTAATYLAEAAQWALNIALDANPIGLVVIAIFALIAALTYLYYNNETVREAIDWLGQTFMQVATIIYDTLIGAFNAIVPTLEGVWTYITTLGGLLPSGVSITGNQIIDGILAVMMFIATLPAQLAVTFANMIAKALGFGSNFVQKVASAATNAASRFMSNISSLPGRLATELQNMLSTVGQWAATLPQKFWDAGVNAVKNFLNALGIHSPGTMQRMMVWEVSEMGRRIPIEGRALLANVSTLGKDVISQFGQPKLSVGIDDNLGNLDIEMNDVMNDELTASLNNENNGTTVVQNVTFEGCTFDKDERVQEVLDIVRYELNWNNSTAGRRV